MYTVVNSNPHDTQHTPWIDVLVCSNGTLCRLSYTWWGCLYLTFCVLLISSNIMSSSLCFKWQDFFLACKAEKYLVIGIYNVLSLPIHQLVCMYFSWFYILTISKSILMNMEVEISSTVWLHCVWNHDQKVKVLNYMAFLDSSF